MRSAVFEIQWTKDLLAFLYKTDIKLTNVNYTKKKERKKEKKTL